MQTRNLQQQHDLWSQAIKDTINKVEKIAKKRTRKYVKRLIRIRNELRK